MQIQPTKLLKISTLVFVLSLAGCASIQKQLNSCETRQAIGTITGAAVGALIATNLADKDKVLWGSLGTAAGGAIGYQLTKLLDQCDQERMLNNTNQTIISDKTHTWSNPSNRTSGTARVVASQTKTEKVKVKVLKEKVKTLPTLDIMGKNYKATKSINVRGGPGTDYVVVNKLQVNEVVNIIGKVKNQDWYLISHNGIGSGFVYAPLMIAAPLEKPNQTNEAIAQTDIKVEEVASNRICKKVEQSVSLANGSTHSETVEACQGPNGWEVKA